MAKRATKKTAKKFRKPIVRAPYTFDKIKKLVTWIKWKTGSKKVLSGQLYAANRGAYHKVYDTDKWDEVGVVEPQRRNVTA